MAPAQASSLALQLPAIDRALTTKENQRARVGAKQQALGRRTSAAGILVPRQATDATTAAPEPLAYGNIAFDMAGNKHDIAALRERRNAAVTKGMNFMHKFFKARARSPAPPAQRQRHSPRSGPQKNNFAALHEIGDDAPSIFFECWYTSANSSIRMHAKEICKQAQRLPEA